MKDIITSRIELLWAKIAGRNVNINTMTPPVASNMTEKLMLEVAERLDGMGSSASGDSAGLMSKADKTKLDGIETGAQKNPGAATTDATGVVKMAANVAYAAGDAPTAAEFKALIDSLVAAGVMAAPAASEQNDG